MQEAPLKSTKFGKGNPGKPKGAVHRNTAAIKDMILTALSDAGGSQYLLERAQDPRTASAFLGLVGKVLPMQVIGDAENPIAHSFTISFKKPSGS